LTLPPWDRDDAVVRANFRCEYCGRNILGTGWELDHIIPISIGGPDALQNIALACGRCNLNKGATIEANDPVTERRVRLFNPRWDEWEDHFRHLNHYVVGTSSVGRATAVAIFRATPSSPIPAPLPDDVGPPIFDGPVQDYLEWLYGQRKAGAYRSIMRQLDAAGLEATLTADTSEPDWDASARLFAIESAAVLAEALTTHAEPDELVSADDLCRSALAVARAVFDARRRERYFRLKRSLAWRQLAVYLALTGHERLAAEAIRASRTSAPEGVEAGSAAAYWRADDRLMRHTVAALEQTWRALAQTADAGKPARLLRLADVVIVGANHTTAEQIGLVQTLDQLVERAGYAQSADLDHGVLIMRRALVAKARFEPSSFDQGVDRRLAQWAAWGGAHNVRAFLYALKHVGDRRFDDVLAQGRSYVEPASRGLLDDIERRLKRLALETA
jgi:hypothetical protein